MNEQAYRDQQQMWLKLCINSRYDLLSPNRPFVFYDPDVQEKIKTEGTKLVKSLVA